MNYPYPQLSFRPLPPPIAPYRPLPPPWCMFMASWLRGLLLKA